MLAAMEAEVRARMEASIKKGESEVSEKTIPTTQVRRCPTEHCADIHAQSCGAAGRTQVKKADRREQTDLGAHCKACGTLIGAQTYHDI